MRRCIKSVIAGLLTFAILGTMGCGKKQEQESTYTFSPRLDTQKKITLSATGFFGNFEALDQVTNDFNEYYPNVEFSYEQVSVQNYENYMEANPNVDIIMTSEEVFEKYGDKVTNNCVDLSKEDVNVSSLDSRMLAREYHNGQLLSIPIGQNMYGLVVNVSLLEKEGLTVPDNYEEFLNVLKVLKSKGYTPIQGPNSKIYAELTQGMAYDMIMNDKTLYDNLKSGNVSAADALKPVYDKLDTLISNGYIDYEVNKSYPDDNYDKAILKFFEGNVPFWVCNTEKVSGMKKRESKSETYQAAPFKYTYIHAPLGDNGVYAYSEPWFGFGVNKNSNNYDYAVEFMRFMSTTDESNKMADIKGVPSIAVKNTDVAIYQDVLNPKKTEMSYINDGTITQSISTNWYTSINKYSSGEIKSGREALEYFVKLCGGK